MLFQNFNCIDYKKLNAIVLGLLIMVSGLTAAETINKTSIISNDRIASMDTSADLPTFIWVDTDQFKPHNLTGALKTHHLKSLSKQLILKLIDSYRLTTAAFNAIYISKIHDTGTGAIVVELNQKFQGLDVIQHRISIVFNRQLQPISMSGYVSPKAPPNRFNYSSLQSAQAISAVILDLTGDSVPHSLWQEINDQNQFQKTVQNSIAESKQQKSTKLMQLPDDFQLKNTTLSRPVRVQAGWYLNSKAELVAVTEVEIETAQNSSVSKMFQYLVTSKQNIVERNSLTSDATKSYKVWANSAGEQLPFAGPQGNSQFPHPTGEDDDTQIIITNPETVTLDSAVFSRLDPWLSASETRTSGNNVNAYVDISLPDGFTPFSDDHQALETSPGVFDYDYNFSADPNINTELQNAAVVQAFYVSNYLHDWLYDAGFDEAAGNGQNNNFGRGGSGGDAILVEVQDFEERNNANMTTPADGSAARMQIFLWDGETSHQLEIEAPSTLAGNYETGAASFGPRSFDITQQLILVDDGVVDPAETDSTIHDACEDPIINASAISGNIAVIDRGVCFFVEKVSRVEALGAVAVIIINQKDDGVITMGAGDNPPLINIPSLMISKADGDPLRTALLNGDNITSRLTRTTSVDRNAGLDNSLVAHEWGHFLSNRLVVLNNTQSLGLGEGWSDFLSLLLLTREEDISNLNGAFSVSAYANNNKNALYFGIRRVPYSVSPNINSLTFKHIADGEALPSTNQIAFGSDGSDNSEEHATGEVWASMLWEGYVNLINDPRHSFSEAQTRMKNYLVASLKATPADPNFVEARDALLSVIAANDATDRQIFMDAFARRGLGIGAIAPAKDSETNQGVVESFETDTVQPPPTPPPSSSGGGGSIGFLLLLILWSRNRLSSKNS